jgi:hypothetical protein
MKTHPRKYPLGKLELSMSFLVSLMIFINLTNGDLHGMICSTELAFVKARIQLRFVSNFSRFVQMMSKKVLALQSSTVTLL